MNTPHYICTGGCKGVSDHHGVCEAEDCPMQGEELLECDCTDEQHEGAFEEEREEMKEEAGDDA